MPRYFFDVEDGHRLFDSSGFVCDDDIAAIIRATVLAIGVSLDKPEDDPERRIAIISDDGREIGTVPVYSRRHTKTRPRKVQPLRRRVQLTVKPAGCSWGFHRINQIGHKLVDVLARGALKRPDIEAKGAGRNPSQHRLCSTHRT